MIDRFVVQLERQLWRDESDYLDVDGYIGILRACAFSRESTVSLIRNELLGVSSTPENEGDSAIITSLLHIIRKEYPSQWEATYSLIREIIWSNSIDRPVQCTCLSSLFLAIVHERTGQLLSISNPWKWR